MIYFLLAGNRPPGRCCGIWACGTPRSRFLQREPVGHDPRRLGAPRTTQTYVSAAHMMRALGAGDRVVCVTASYGGSRSPDEVRWPPGGDLAKVRSQAPPALAVLGVTEHHWLDYPDGGCAQVPLAEGAARIHEQLQAARPYTVMTFGPGLRDRASGPHQRVPLGGCRPGRATTATRPRCSGDRLERMGRRMGRSSSRSGCSSATSRSRSPAPTSARTCASPRTRSTPELQALLCQVSQVTPMVDELGIEQYALAIAEEGFR